MGAAPRLTAARRPLPRQSSSPDGADPGSCCGRQPEEMPATVEFSRQCGGGRTVSGDAVASDEPSIVAAGCVDHSARLQRGYQTCWTATLRKKKRSAAEASRPESLAGKGGPGVGDAARLRRSCAFAGEVHASDVCRAWRSAADRGERALSRAAPVGRREPPPCLLHGRKRGLGLRQRARPNIDARGLRGDRDLLATRGVASRPLLRGRLDSDRQLHEPADTNLLGIPKLLENDLIEGVQCSLRIRLADLGAVRDRRDHLGLGQRHGDSSSNGVA